MKKNKTRAGGFSLIEVLVAFAILALSLGVLMRIFGGGVKMAVISEDYSRAVMLAESNLSAVGIEEALEESVVEGDSEEKYHWTLSITQYQTEDEEIDLDKMSVKPYLIESRVEWGQEDRIRSVVLNTLRLSSGNGTGLSSNGASPEGRNDEDPFVSTFPDADDDSEFSD
ncbi:MAG: prepilin-type N-terminal cleavage/methylation domain-containing protein [Methylococcales bacterium]